MENFLLTEPVPSPACRSCPDLLSVGDRGSSGGLTGSPYDQVLTVSLEAPDDRCEEAKDGGHDGGGVVGPGGGNAAGDEEEEALDYRVHQQRDVPVDEVDGLEEAQREDDDDGEEDEHGGEGDGEHERVIARGGGGGDHKDEAQPEDRQVEDSWERFNVTHVYSETGH